MKQIPSNNNPAASRSGLKLDLKSRGLSQSVVITPQGDKKVDFTGYNTATNNNNITTNTVIPVKTAADPTQSGN